MIDTENSIQITATLPPMHPGEVLREEFLEPLALSAGKVAKACHLPRTRIERIVREEVGITSDTALRLACYFGTSVDFWINLQAQHDSEMAKIEGNKIASSIVPFEYKAA